MRRALAAAVLLLVCGGCVKIKVVHDDGGAGGDMLGPVLHAQVLYVLNLERSAANLTNSYVGIISLVNDLATQAHVAIDQLAIVPLYGTTNGQPRLLFGQAGGVGDPSNALLVAANSGAFDAPAAGTARSHRPRTNIRSRWCWRVINRKRWPRTCASSTKSARICTRN